MIVAQLHKISVHCKKRLAIFLIIPGQGEFG